MKRQSSLSENWVLKEKIWKIETSSMLEEIRDALYLHSDFDGAAEKANLLIKNRENV